MPVEEEREAAAEQLPEPEPGAGADAAGHACTREPKYDFSAPRPSVETAMCVMGHAAFGWPSDPPGGAPEPNADVPPTSPAAEFASAAAPATTVSGDEPIATAIRASVAAAAPAPSAVEIERKPTEERRLELGPGAAVARAESLYYSLANLPPQTSKRAFLRALRAGLPVTRIGYAEVVTKENWLAWVERNAKPRRRKALGAAPTDDEILASPGARPKGRKSP